MLGETIQKLRRARRFSQEALAEAVGVSRQTVAKWESGESVPDLHMAAALAELFGTSVDYLAERRPGDGEEGRYMFGAVRMNDRGQISLPKKCRDVFGLESGDLILVLGDVHSGIALVKLSGDMFPMPDTEGGSES